MSTARTVNTQWDATRFLPALLSKDLATVAVGTCEECEEFTIHKTLLCGRSSFFDAALNGSFQEAAANRVELKEESPMVFKGFLHWLYTSRLPQTNDRGEETQAPEHFVLQLFALGDKLFVPDMQDLCWTWLREYYGTSDFPDPEFINMLYNLTDDSSRLRKYFVQLCCHLISENKEMHMSWDDVLDSNETFASDVAKSLTKRMRSPSRAQDTHPYTMNMFVHFREDKRPPLSSRQNNAIIKQLMIRVKDLASDTSDSRTFADWPHRIPSSQSMIAAGWIHKPTTESGEDRVTCHYCGKSTFNWKPEHDPLERHRFWSPKCPFVLAVDAGLNLT